MSIKHFEGIIAGILAGIIAGIIAGIFPVNFTNVSKS
jgi:hypothetical protein